MCTLEDSPDAQPICNTDVGGRTVRLPNGSEELRQAREGPLVEKALVHLLEKLVIVAVINTDSHQHRT